MLHDLGLEFRTPTINLFFTADDFLKYIDNIDYYNSQNLVFLKKEEVDVNYPVALCGDIRIWFMHYNSEYEAEAKWFQRIRKIDKDNLFIIFSDLSKGCTYEHLRMFDKMNFKHKIVFTGLRYNEIESSVYIEGFEEEGHVGNLISYRGRYTGKRFYDSFDYVSWLNDE